MTCVSHSPLPIMKSMDCVCQPLCIVNVIWKWNYGHLKAFVVSMYISQQFKGNLWKSMFKCNSECCCCVQIVSWKKIMKFICSVMEKKKDKFPLKMWCFFYSKDELLELIAFPSHSGRRYHPACDAQSWGKENCAHFTQCWDNAKGRWSSFPKRVQAVIDNVSKWIYTYEYFKFCAQQMLQIWHYRYYKIRPSHLRIYVPSHLPCVCVTLL